MRPLWSFSRCGPLHRPFSLSTDASSAPALDYLPQWAVHVRARVEGGHRGLLKLIMSSSVTSKAPHNRRGLGEIRDRDLRLHYAKLTAQARARRQRRQVPSPHWSSLPGPFRSHSHPPWGGRNSQDLRATDPVPPWSRPCLRCAAGDSNRSYGLSRVQHTLGPCRRWT